NAAYRAVAAAGPIGDVTCGELDSAHVRGAVRAAVSLALHPPNLGAGGCSTVRMSVAPDKSGQTAVLQRKGSGGWSRVASVRLDARSAAPTSICRRWNAVGERLRLRAVWPKQDAANVRGRS